MMCRGCEDFIEFERAVDAFIASELPKMVAEPLDHAAFYGRVK